MPKIQAAIHEHKFEEGKKHRQAQFRDYKNTRITKTAHTINCIYLLEMAFTKRTNL